MRRFQFRLAMVRDFRRQQLELEEGKLQKLHAERQEMEAESARIEVEVARTRASLMVTSSAEAFELVTADLYLRHLASAKKSQAGKLADWQTRLRQQQDAILEARRRVRLMEKIEERQFRAWRMAADREQENLASELYLAHWKR